MERTRIIKGNNTTIPKGAEVMSEYRTYAVTERAAEEKGGQPISDLRCVIESREYMIENKK